MPHAPHTAFKPLQGASVLGDQLRRVCLACHNAYGCANDANGPEPNSTCIARKHICGRSTLEQRQARTQDTLFAS